MSREQSRQAPATAPAVRTSRPGRPARPVHNRRKTLNLVDGIIVGGIAIADAAAVAYVEKGMIAGHAASHGHHAVPPATLAELVVAGVAFGSPILLIILVALVLHSRKARMTTPPPAPRPVVPFGYRGRM